MGKRGRKKGEGREKIKGSSATTRKS